MADTPFLLVARPGLTKSALGMADIARAFRGAATWAGAHPRTTTGVGLPATLGAIGGVQAMAGSHRPMTVPGAAPTGATPPVATPPPVAPPTAPKPTAEPNMFESAVNQGNDHLQSAWGQVKPHLQSAWGSVKPHLGPVGDFMENHPYWAGGIGGAGLLSLMSLLNRDDEEEEKKGAARGDAFFPRGLLTRTRRPATGR